LLEEIGKQRAGRMVVKLEKYEALGNSYAVAFNESLQLFEQLGLQQEQKGMVETFVRILPGLTKRLSSSEYGLGTDGLLLLSSHFVTSKELPLPPAQNEENEPLALSEGSPNREELKWHLQIFNPDGTEAEKSGNGIRIAALALLRYGATFPLCLHTKGGLVQVELLSSAQDESLGYISATTRVEMGTAVTTNDAVFPLYGPAPPCFPEGAATPHFSISSSVLPSSSPLFFEGVSLGNPHAVARAEDGLSVRVLARAVIDVGERVEHACEGRTNVQVFSLATQRAGVDDIEKSGKQKRDEKGTRQKVRAAIWERGAGHTLASGSSSCAVAVVASIRCRGGVEAEAVTEEEEWEVEMEGGTLLITLSPTSRVREGALADVKMEGDARLICCCSLPAAALLP